ncbi:unnamed protein product [Euphydryas editha]|uniref:G-protein coupled receptors family 1 profile domain-containing protein n=1 Tax=Euphydryas editha TaxID=104508 RepID=A0AAU9TW00_EUPED|nr:unnamed protein product [Euphydryas editha]
MVILRRSDINVLLESFSLFCWSSTKVLRAPKVASSIPLEAGLMSGLLGRCFFKRCYDLFGELMDALALLNGAINFILYCSMSKQFRTNFRHILWNRCSPAPRASSHTELQTTYV